MFVIFDLNACIWMTTLELIVWQKTTANTWVYNHFGESLPKIAASKTVFVCQSSGLFQSVHLSTCLSVYHNFMYWPALVYYLEHSCCSLCRINNCSYLCGHTAAPQLCPSGGLNWIIKRRVLSERTLQQHWRVYERRF